MIKVSVFCRRSVSFASGAGYDHIACPDGSQEQPEKKESSSGITAKILVSSGFSSAIDTYLALDRLRDLLDLSTELVGNEHLNERGSPSGGTGYLLLDEL